MPFLASSEVSLFHACCHYVLAVLWLLLIRVSVGEISVSYCVSTCTTAVQEAGAAGEVVRLCML